MPAYCRCDDFMNRNVSHNIKGILQTIYKITDNDKIMLEMQYGTNPAGNITDTYIGRFSDTFNYTATYSKSF